MRRAAECSDCHNMTHADREDTVALCPLHAASGDLLAALRRLSDLVGALPENAAGTVQGADLNRAYSAACDAIADATGAA